MSADPLTTRPRAADDPQTAAAATRDTWQEIENLVDELAGLAKTDLTAHEFYARLLDRSVRALAAVGGAVWLREGNSWRIEYQINLAQARGGNTRATHEANLARVETLTQTGEVKVLPPNSGSGRDSASANPSDFLLLAGPMRSEGEGFGLIEIFQRTGVSPAAQRGYVQLLGVLCETAVDFYRNRELRDLKQLEKLWNQFDRFAETAHGSLDLDCTAFTIANEGRRLIGCSRVSVAVRRGRKTRLTAMSGIDEFDRRSNVVRLLEQVVKAVLATGESLWYRGASEHLSPQLESALHNYIEESHVRLLAVTPLAPVADGPTASPLVGALIVEDFEAPADEDGTRQRAQVVARHAASALRNAQAHRNIPFSRTLEALGRLSWFVRLRQLPLTVLVLLAAVGVLAALATIPAEFTIEGRGELQPEVRRDIFAPSDGVVSELFVQHGDLVAAHQSDQPASGVLLRLRNLELEFEFSRVMGEKQTAETELSAVQAARLSASPSDPDAREKYNQLTAKEEELKELLKSLQTQLGVLRAQQAELAVHSPIAGQVLTWNVSQSLETRPVKRGQTLLTIAQTDGPWVLEMHVPDSHIGYVLAAQRDQGEELDVSFMLKTDPGKTYTGRVISVAKTTSADAAQAGTVLVTAAVDKAELQGLRPGATVVARIACGRRPIGYVWFHDLIETIRTKIMF